MLSSLLLKEWLKLKRYFIAALLLNIGICLKIFFDIRQQIYSEHSEMVWYQAIHIQTVLYQDIRYLPLITGLVLAAAQFVPEMMGRRLRLSLHLPGSREVMLFFSLFSGFLLFLMICGLDAVLIYLTLKMYFPVEVAVSSLPTMLPWILAGLLAYFGGVTVLLEMNWSRRIFLSLVFAVLISMLFSGSGYGWFIPALPWLILLAPLALLSVFESGRRFQERGV
jgi:hypothetical protein